MPFHRYLPTNMLSESDGCVNDNVWNDDSGNPGCIWGAAGAGPGRVRRDDMQPDQEAKAQKTGSRLPIGTIRPGPRVVR